MTLRIRLAAILAFTVLVPIAVSVVVVAAVLPARLDQQVRLQVRDGLASSQRDLARACDQLGLTAQLLGVLGLAEPPPAAVDHVVSVGAAHWAALADGAGRVLATAGTSTGPVPGPADGNCRTVAGAGQRQLVASFTARNARGVADRAVVAAPLPAMASGTATVLARGRSVVYDGQLGRQAATLAAAVAGHPGTAAVGSFLVRAAGPRPGQPFTVIEAAVRPDLSRVQLLAVAVLVGALLVAYTLGRQLASIATSPLVELAEAADRVAGGDLDTVVPVRSRDEVGRLAHAFNEMTDSLRSHVGELQRSRDEVRRSVTRLGEAIARTNDLTGLLDVVLDGCRATLRARSGAVFSTDIHGNLRVDTGSGVDAHVVLPAGTGVAGAAADRDQGLVWPDTAGVTPAAEEPAHTAALAVPIRRRGQVFAVLALYDRLDGAGFSADDLDTATSLAAHASTAVENVLLHDEARRLSITDSLTGLWNRRYFVMNVGKEIDRAARFGRPLSLLMLDLDHFKAVNDTYGHQLGDEVLAELATRVKSQIREVDLLARYGGEELVLVLPEADAAGAARTAERICAAVRETPFARAVGTPVPLTVSVGAAVFPTAGASPDELVRSADVALYEAKAAGRDRWRLVGGSAPAAAGLGGPVAG